MQFKIDTKEKLVIFRLEETTLDAKMSDELVSIITDMDDLNGKNLVLDLRSLQSTDPQTLEAILTVYRKQYTHELSCAIFGLNSTLTNIFTRDYPDVQNIVPTESEAIDMVMMEDFERELDFDND